MAQIDLRHDMEAFKVLNFPHLNLGLKIGEVYTKAELKRRCNRFPDKDWRINELERKLNDHSIFTKIKAKELVEKRDPEEPAEKVRKKMYVFRPGDLSYSCEED